MANNITPPAQLTEDHWRRQTGAGERTPRSLDYSASQGDKEKNSLGPGRYDRTFVRYVANDDGTPIAEGVEGLLVNLINEILELEKRVDGVSITLVETPNPIVFETAPIYPIGIG